MKQIGALAAGLMMAGSVAANSLAGDPRDYGLLSKGEPGYFFTPLSASANTVASRGFVSRTQPLYGGFSLAAASTVYILVRGNSMNTLGITSNYLDQPRVRLFDQANSDLINVSGSSFPGANGCSGANLTVATYYQNRGIPTATGDFCVVATLSAGAYTFTVNSSAAGVNTNGTNSSPSSGEVLFEVTLGP
jgi:hypothetical protein